MITSRHSLIDVWKESSLALLYEKFLQSLYPGGTIFLALMKDRQIPYRQ